MRWHCLAAAIAACCSTPAWAEESASSQGSADAAPMALEERFSLEGVVEGEWSIVDPYDGSKRDDSFSIATFELTAGAQLTDQLRAEMVLLFEQDETEPIDVDQFFLAWGDEDAMAAGFSGGGAHLVPFASAGRMYVPFGRFDTNMVSDPLTLELGETREGALQLGAAYGHLVGSAYLFDGTVEDGGDKHAFENFGAQLDWVMEGDERSLNVGASYISNIAESDNLEGTVPGEIKDKVAGIGLHASYSQGPWNIIGEYVGALDRFGADELAYRDGGAQPMAWNIEAGYGFELWEREASFSVGHQRSDEAVALGLPESVTLATLSVAMVEHVAVNFEFAVADDYSKSEGGSGDSGSAFTMQLAAEF